MNFGVFGLAEEAESTTLLLQVLPNRCGRIKGIGRKNIQAQGVHGALLVCQGDWRERVLSPRLARESALDINPTHVATNRRSGVVDLAS